MRHPEQVSQGHFEATISKCERLDIVCPLCGINFTLQTLKQHLGLHLQEVALFALPYLGEGSSGSKPDALGSSSESSGERLSRKSSFESNSDIDQPIISSAARIECICSYHHDDGFLINCDKCNKWQHGVCMGIDENNVPEVYLCSECTPGVHNLKIEEAVNVQGSFLKSYQSLLSTSRGLGLDKRELAVLRHMVAKRPELAGVFRCKHAGCTVPPFQTQYLLE